MDTRVLLSLDFMQIVHKFLVVLVQLVIVMENILNELVEPIPRDDGRLRFTQE